MLQDETTIRYYQALHCEWFLRGQQRIIFTYGKNQSVKPIGVLNYENGETFCVEEEHFSVFLSKNIGALS